MKIKQTLVALFALVSLSANAGFLVEPYLGYKVGSGDQGGVTPIDYTLNGPSLGGRLGYQFLGLMGGVDYSFGSIDLEAAVTVAGVETKSTSSQDQKDLGVFLGYDFPILLRAWATYYLSSKLTQSNDDENSGGGYGLGVGFTGLPFVSLNVEYRALSYDEFFNSSTGQTSTRANKIENKEILFSVSLPLDL